MTVPPLRRIGAVDGSVEAGTRRFHVVLDDDAKVQLDDLLVCRQQLPDGSGEVAHYRIVVEQTGVLEGAHWPSDTRHVVDGTMPGGPVRRAEGLGLRAEPELWLAPSPGAVVHAATGDARTKALFVDQMRKPLAVGLD